MSSLHGRGARVDLSGPGWGPATITEARSWKFDVDMDFIQVPTFANAWKDTIPTFFSWTAAIEGNLDTTQDIFGLVLAQMQAPTTGYVGFTAGSIYLYPDRGNTARYYFGQCWFKLTADIRVQNTERFSMEIIGTGELANK